MNLILQYLKLPEIQSIAILSNVIVACSIKVVIIEGLDTSNSEENIKAKKMAVAAMKKQIPQRPVEHFTGNEWECKCPVCGGITDTPTEVIEECIQYCGWCGQRLDWSDKQ